MSWLASKLHFLPLVPDYEWGCCMRALSLLSAQCHGLKQGTPFMHSLWFCLIRLWAQCVFSSLCLFRCTCMPVCFYRVWELIASLAGFSPGTYLCVLQAQVSICIHGLFLFFGFDSRRQRIRPHIRKGGMRLLSPNSVQDFPTLRPVVKPTQAFMAVLPLCSPLPKTAPNSVTYFRAHSESLTRKRGFCFHFIQMLNCELSLFEANHQCSPQSHLSSPFCSLYLVF